MKSAFEQLKIAVTAQYRSRYPETGAEIGLWRGREIAQFRQDLAEKVGGQISEKSFYTYFKNSDNEKLPRIDVLDLLSQYAGFAHWAAFRASCYPAENEEIDAIGTANVLENLEKNSTVLQNTVLQNTVLQNVAIEKTNPPLQHNEKTDVVKKASKKVNKTSFIARWKKLVAAAIFILFLAAGQWLWAAFYQKPLISCQFCLINADSRAPLKGANMAIHQTEEGQSPRLIFADSVTGCFSLQAENGAMLNFIVNAPYHHRQNISRKAMPQNTAELVALRTDDYALMLHYFSTSKVADWQARRQQLQNILSDNLQVVQIARESGSGIAIYTKSEFIDKLTLPINSLKNIDIIETRYDDEQRAIYIRFQ